MRAKHAAVSCAVMSCPRPVVPSQYATHWGSHPSVSSPTRFSLISPAGFQESQANPRQRYSSSPEFDDGFNPNVLFPCPAPRPPSAFNVENQRPLLHLSGVSRPFVRWRGARRSRPGTWRATTPRYLE